MDNKKMKVAMIGAGHWGKNLLKELSLYTDVLYTCTKDSNNTDKALSDPSVEAVFIATPTDTHFDIAMLAFEAGKHVFLEKPGTTSSADLKKLLSKSQEKGLKFAIGYEFPHHPAAKKLKELIQNKKIKSIHFDWQKWGTFKDNAKFHLLCHDISLMKYFSLNNLSLISFKQTRVISDTDIIETEFNNNIKSIINRVSPIKQKTITVVTDDDVHIWSNNWLSKISPETQTLIEIPLPETTSVSEEIKDFLNAIKENRQPLINGEFALDVYRTIEKINP